MPPSQSRSLRLSRRLSLQGQHYPCVPRPSPFSHRRTPGMVAAFHLHHSGHFRCGDHCQSNRDHDSTGRANSTPRDPARDDRNCLFQPGTLCGHASTSAGNPRQWRSATGLHRPPRQHVTAAGGGICQPDLRRRRFSHLRFFCCCQPATPPWQA